MLYVFYYSCKKENVLLFKTDSTSSNNKNPKILGKIYPKKFIATLLKQKKIKTT